MYSSHLNVGIHDKVAEDIVEIVLRTCNRYTLRRGGGAKDTVDGQYFMEQTLRTLRSILSLSRSLLWLRECLEQFPPTNLAFWRLSATGLQNSAKFTSSQISLSNFPPRQYHHLTTYK